MKAEKKISRVVSFISFYAQIPDDKHTYMHTQMMFRKVCAPYPKPTHVMEW